MAWRRTGGRPDGTGELSSHLKPLKGNFLSTGLYEKNESALCRKSFQRVIDAKLKLPLTCLEGEVVHHLQSSHHQQVWFEPLKFAGEILHGGQVRIMVVTVDDVSTGHKEIAQLSPKQHNFERKHGYTYRSTESEK